MRQFDVFPNPDTSSRTRFPYLVVLQSDLLERLEDIVVAPLRDPRQGKPVPMLRLNPGVEVMGATYLIFMQSLAAIPRRLLTAPVANLSPRRDEIIAALDVLFTGL
ncbi:MAG: CcdB family protein [Zoogloeaceae bacterium]|jgi:toxin CcdB|nr:CcdB family protein [Zoogloeaceae bacterium]